MDNNSFAVSFKGVGKRDIVKVVGNCQFPKPSPVGASVESCVSIRVRVSVVSSVIHRNHHRLVINPNNRARGVGGSMEGVGSLEVGKGLELR